MMEPVSEEHHNKEYYEIREKVALLEGWMHGEGHRYERLEQDLIGVKGSLEALRSEMNHRFVSLEEKFDRRLLAVEDRISDVTADLSGRIQGVSDRTDTLAEKIDETNRRIDEMAKHLGGRIDATNDRIDETNRRIDETNLRVDEMAKHLGDRIDETNRRINQLVWLMLVTSLGVITNLVVLLVK